MESLDPRAKLVVEAFTKVAKNLSKNPERVRVKVTKVETLSPTNQGSQTGKQNIAAAAK